MTTRNQAAPLGRSGSNGVNLLINPAMTINQRLDWAIDASQPPYSPSTGEGNDGLYVADMWKIINPKNAPWNAIQANWIGSNPNPNIGGTLGTYGPCMQMQFLGINGPGGTNPVSALNYQNSCSVRQYLLDYHQAGSAYAATGLDVAIHNLAGKRLTFSMDVMSNVKGVHLRWGPLVSQPTAWNGTYSLATHPGDGRRRKLVLHFTAPANLLSSDMPNLYVELAFSPTSPVMAHMSEAVTSNDDPGYAGTSIRFGNACLQEGWVYDPEYIPVDPTTDFMRCQSYLQRLPLDNHPLSVVIHDTTTGDLDLVSNWSFATPMSRYPNVSPVVHVKGTEKVRVTDPSIANGVDLTLVASALLTSGLNEYDGIFSGLRAAWTATIGSGATYPSITDAAFTTYPANDPGYLIVDVSP